MAHSGVTRLETKFHIDPLLGRSICHVPWPKVNPIVPPTSYPTHIPFIPSESTLPFLRYSNFNILPWKSKVKVMGEVKVQSHNVSLTSYRLIPLVPCQSGETDISKFKLENSGSRSWMRTKSQHGPNIQSTHIPSVPCQSGIQVPQAAYWKETCRYSFLNIVIKTGIQNHSLPSGSLSPKDNDHSRNQTTGKGFINAWLILII